MGRNHNHNVIVGATLVGIILVLGLLAVLTSKGSENGGLNSEINLVSEKIVGSDVYERVYEVRAERQLTAHEFYALVGNFVYEFGFKNPTFSVMKDSIGMRHDIQRFWFRYERVEER